MGNDKYLRMRAVVIDGNLCVPARPADLVEHAEIELIEAAAVDELREEFAAVRAEFDHWSESVLELTGLVKQISERI